MPLSELRCSECDSPTINVCPNCKAVGLCDSCKSVVEICGYCDEGPDDGDDEDGGGDSDDV